MKNSIINILADKKAEMFIKNNSHLSPQDIMLKYYGKTDLPIKEITEQIECRKKAEKKLPSLITHSLIYKKISLEQSSSEITAEYKSSKLKGKRLIDLTGGLGIDSIYFSKIFDEVIYCEQSKELCEIADHNFNALGITNIKVNNADGIEFLKNYDDKFFDWIYIDPSRRNKTKRSVDIKYYSPNVVSNFPLLKSKTKNLLLKLAPAFDLTEAYKLFPRLNEFSVISVNNECKEVLLFFNFDQHLLNPQIKSAVVLNQNTEKQIFNSNVGDSTTRTFEEPDENFYFYEPDAAIRKAGLSAIIADKFKMNFLNPLSDYMVSNRKNISFPGRKFRIEYKCRYNIKEVKKYLIENGIAKANIARSNFPLKPEEIKQKLKLQEGGKEYLFFSKNSEDKLMFMLCRRIDEI